MRASPQTQAAIKATLTQWADAYTHRNLDQVLALIAPDDDIVAIGTGQDEWRVGTGELRAQIERDFSQAEALSVEYEPADGVGGWTSGVGGRAGQRASAR
jgi:ketosteroid isomerase-like protein